MTSQQQSHRVMSERLYEKALAAVDAERRTSRSADSGSGDSK